MTYNMVLVGERAIKYGGFSHLALQRLREIPRV